MLNNNQQAKEAFEIGRKKATLKKLFDAININESFNELYENIMKEHGYLINKERYVPSAEQLVEDLT